MTPNNEVLLHFHSDEDTTDTGFHIAYSAIPGIPGCGGIFTSTDGEISTPISYEDKTYPNNLECEYLIKQPKDTKIRLEVLQFHLEEGTECKFDALEIYDGKTSNDPLVGRFCGFIIPKIIESQTNEMLLRFTSDWSTQHGGFVIRYRSICGGTYGEPTGIITSPYYPLEYQGGAFCKYTIEAPLGSAIKLDFLEFNLEENEVCMYDYVQIYDGHVSNETSLGRFCGNTKPPQVGEICFLLHSNSK